MRDRPETATLKRTKTMTKNIAQIVGFNNEDQIADRLVRNLARHADEFGVGISDGLMNGLEDFFAEVAREEREEAIYDESYNGLVASVADRLASALQRMAADIENENI